MERHSASQIIRASPSKGANKRGNRFAQLGEFYHRTSSITVDVLVKAGTLPYYRFFRQNTLLPILRIRKCVRRGDSDDEMVEVITHWRQRKLHELQFIQVASTILAAGIVGCFSWPEPFAGHWLGPALWYSALVFSILAILLSSSQSFIFNALNPPTAEMGSTGDYRRYLSLIVNVSIPTTSTNPVSPIQDNRIETDPENERAILKECSPRWKMVFTWQAPMMFMAYGVCFFGVGLTLYICTPLIRGEVWTDATKIAYFYLTMLAMAGSTFSYCSYWAYRFIDLERVVELD